MNIFFVCTGNTCRSPMAEAILKSMKLPGVQVRSAGLFAGGGSLSPNAKSVLDGQGIDFDHWSRSVTPEDVDWASLILTMTTSHKRLLTEQYPEAAGKIYTLKEYTGAFGGDVSDPYGGPEPVYQQTFEELQELLAKLKSKLAEQ